MRLLPRLEYERKYCPRWYVIGRQSPKLGSQGRFWTVGSLLIAGLVILPIATVAWLSLFPTENIWAHLTNTVLPGYVRRTLVLMTGVGVGSLLLGVSTAWLVTMCDLPGRRVFEWLLLLPFAVPAYVIAYVYTDLLEYAGPVQSYLRTVTGWGSPREYWFPEIRSMGGAISMMSLVMYPYVYLLARTAFLEQSVAMLDASRILGYGAWGSFFRVSLPLARPAIAVGVALVAMETLNDFGTVDFFAIRTLTAGIYDVWQGMGNLGGAAQIAVVMLGFVLVLLSVEHYGRRRQQQFSSLRRMQPLPRYALKNWQAGAAFMLCLLPTVAGFVVPAVVLGNYAYERFGTSWTPAFRTYAMNSLLLSAAAAAVAVAAAVFLCYARRLHSSRLLNGAARVACLGYALPGAVLAIGVIIPFAAWDNWLDARLRVLLGFSTGLLLSGTVFALLFAYVVRFMAVALGSVESSLAKITPNMDSAARVLGHGPFSILWRVHLPLIRGGMLTGALVVFVDCMKELPATLILRPFNFETLATYVYQFASDELLEQSALAALMIVATGLFPVILLSQTISKARMHKV